MKCLKCQNELAQNIKFCPECGTEVPKPLPKPNEIKQFPPILNANLAAEFLTISRAQLYMLIREDALPWFPMGARKAFITDELIAWAKKRSRGGVNNIIQADSSCQRVAN
ncbi:hypothetical protein SDC9_04175 [bioreactor metagenome]|uniref:Zinc-ribbon domain-containing protein n=1 Tax=bioreactor metagenome TaxID=1076179 RepID=A0A644SYC2_9ZZZZ|nr:zinc ribbon domain-containing protein [Negativicutes bacterium]